MRVLVTGGAGFLGSHLCDALIARGDEVICMDNLSTGQASNVVHLLANEKFTFISADVTAAPEDIGTVDAILHMACPASPKDYFRLPLETLKIGSVGAEYVLGLAERYSARVLLASTSEVYGEPQVHPQPESYWGNVNPIGVRSVYDEAKRYSEALFMAHHRERGTDTAIIRIFNTYGPRLRPSDGRVVSNFVAQALSGQPITIYGDGSQTRSFCFVDDLVRGILAMFDSRESGPVNLGNPTEVSVRDLAATIIEMAGSSSPVENHPLPLDDPTVRRPDISRAGELLGWQPQIALAEGLERTIAWQRSLGPQALVAGDAKLEVITTTDKLHAAAIIKEDTHV